MTSNIRSYISLIDESYPKPGANQSSAGFRDNFDAIKKALVIADTEVSDIQVKKIVIEGDATGVSGLIGTGPDDPAAINLVLEPTGVVEGSYNSERADIEFTVDAKGRLTNVTRTPHATYPVAGTYSGTIQNYTPVNAGGNPVATRSIKVPSLTINEWGEVTNVTETTLEGFGIQGHPLPRASLLVGNDVNESSFLTPPTDTFVNNDLWVLSWDPFNGGPTHLRWRKLATNNGTVTGITGNTGIKVDNTTAAQPIVSLDVQNLPEFPNGATVAANDYSIIFDTSTGNTYKIRSDRNGGFGSTGGDGYKLVNDPEPKLGAPLDVRGNIIGTSIGNVNIQAAVGDLLLNNQKWPKVMGAPNSVLTSDGGGNISWRTPQAPEPGVTLITASRGIRTSPVTGIMSTGSLTLDFMSLPTRDINPDHDYVATQNFLDNSMGRSRISEVLPRFGKTIVVDNSRQGTDVGDGSFGKPFRTITAALASIPNPNWTNTNIVVMPGDYREDVDINRMNISIVGVGGPTITNIKGKITVRAGLTYTRLAGLNVDVREAGSTSTARAFLIPNGVDTLYVENCRFDSMSYYDSPMTIMELVGRNTGPVQFINCMINGEVLNNLAGVYQSGYENVEREIHVVFSNLIGSVRNVMGLRTKPGSYTVVDGSGFLGCITHEGGVLEVSNVRIFANLSGDGVVSTAPLSATNVDGQAPKDNYLILSNVNMQTFQFGDSVWGRINKTGACMYQLTNVNRDASVDILTGVRDGYGAQGVDVGESLRKINASGTITLNVNTGTTWEVTLTGNAVLNLDAPDFVHTQRLVSITPTPTYGPARDAVRSMTVVVRQDSTGSRTLNFTTAQGTIIWDNSAGMPAVASGANKVTMYTFVKVGNTWMGGRSFVQS